MQTCVGILTNFSTKSLVNHALTADEKNLFYHFAKGLLEYREGRWENSLAIMKGDAAGVMGPAPRLIEAMALQQQERADEARQTLAAAIAAFDWRPERTDDRNAWIYHILRREAESLIPTK
jgi:serine/threonine-protein kinase